MKQFLLQLAAFWLTGCSQNLDITGQTLEVTTYNRNPGKLGLVVSKSQILPSSYEHQKLSSWLQSNRWGWWPAFANYIPNVVVRGSNFGMNILDDLTFVVTGKHGGMHYTKKIPASELRFLIGEKPETENRK